MTVSGVLKAVVREMIIIALCVGAAFGIGKLGPYIPNIGQEFFSIQIAVILYLITIVMRIIGAFLSATFKVVIITIVLVIGFLLLVAKYPELFPFMKKQTVSVDAS